MFVRLVLAGGLNAGLVAEIKQGYYLVGRDQECQIRPESDSVSERHCLLQHEDDVFRLFVLDDDSPTLLNHQPVKPKQWVLLNHGDMLQVGRVAFLVAITAHDPSSPASGNTPSALPSQQQPNSAAVADEDFAMRDTAEIDANVAEQQANKSGATNRQPAAGRWQNPKKKVKATARRASEPKLEPQPKSAPPPPPVVPATAARRHRLPSLDWHLLLAFAILIAAVGLGAYGTYAFFKRPNTDVRLTPDID